LAITGFAARSNLDSPTDYEAFIEVKSSYGEKREVEVQLLLDGSVFDLASITVPPGGRVQHIFQEKMRVGGILEARINNADPLMADNHAYDVLTIPMRQRILLVTDETNPKTFLVKAISSNSASCEGMVITPEQYRKTIMPDPDKLKEQRDVLVFDRWIPDQAEKIPELHILAIDCVPPQMPAAKLEVFQKPIIRKWDRGHPLMSYLNFRNVFFSQARKITLNEKKELDSPIENVAEFVSSPFVLSWESEVVDDVSQKFVALAFNPQDSDIALRKELPLLLWNSLS